VSDHSGVKQHYYVVCKICGTQIDYDRVGRPSEYCSDKCRALAALLRSSWRGPKAQRHSCRRAPTLT
jgi:hypothetical protein